MDGAQRLRLLRIDLSLSQQHVDQNAHRSRVDFVKRHRTGVYLMQAFAGTLKDVPDGFRLPGLACRKEEKLRLEEFNPFAHGRPRSRAITRQVQEFGVAMTDDQDTAEAPMFGENLGEVVSHLRFGRCLNDGDPLAWQPALDDLAKAGSEMQALPGEFA